MKTNQPHNSTTMNLRLITLITILLNTLSYGQESPTLNLTGSSPSLAKGTINTEILTAIIQKKQEEIKERVFRNTIVKQFKDPENHYSHKLNNFATFNYLYSLMDILTSGKNKTVMTKSAIENTAEFSFVFGLALYVDNQTVENAKVELEVKNDGDKISVADNTGVKEFNLLIDLCYKIIIENKEKYQNQFKFKHSLNDINFKRWYESDNVFIKEMNNAVKSNNAQRVDELNNIRQDVTQKIENIFLLAGQAAELVALGKRIADNGLKKELNKLAGDLETLDGSQISKKIDSITVSYENLLSPNQKTYLAKLSNIVNSDFDNYKELYNFYKSLSKNQYQDFTLTRNQYYAMKYIVVKFINIAKNQYPNDAIATVLDFLLENTLVEFNDLSGNLISENSNNDQSIGYLYVDIESLISTIDQRFNSITRKGILNYVTPFFSIGTNYASFSDSNNLLADNNSIGNLYYASEKIGVKWKLWNWKYTHSFPAGESFSYYGKRTYWLRPQEEPLLSDVHLFAYGSGLLYNLVDLKSDDSFDYALVGVGVGFTFFNGLSANFSVASPIVDKSISSKNSYLNVGLDIPIIEYISALTNKK